MFHHVSDTPGAREEWLLLSGRSVLPSRVVLRASVGCPLPLRPRRGHAGRAGGTATPDGIDFAGTSYLSLPVNAIVQTLADADGPGPGTSGGVDYPFVRDTSGALLQVCCTAGGEATSPDNGRASGTWTPADPHDSGGPVAGDGAGPLGPGDPGSTCRLTIGALATGSGGLAVLALRVDDPLAPGVTEILNTASIADDGTNGLDANPADNNDSDRDRRVFGSDLTKSLADTSQGHTSGLAAAIGEILTYEVTLTIPPGTLQTMRLVDVLDPGLAFVDCVSIRPSSEDITSSLGSFDAACSAPANPQVEAEPPGDPEPLNEGRRITFDLGDVSNYGGSDGTLRLGYTAVVLDAAPVVRDRRSPTASPGRGKAVACRGRRQASPSSSRG
ncbi:MAG: isopeptide-forming domain-containing fimbrial protein [Chloroflexota bacterium]